MATTLIDKFVTKLKFITDNRGLKKTEEGMKGLRRSTSFLNTRLGSLKGVLFSLAGAFAAIRAIDVFTDQEEAVSNLTQALKNAGAAAPVTLKQLTAFADEQERLTKVSNEKILASVSAPLVVSGVAKTKAQFFQIQKIILNLGALTKQDVSSTSRQVVESLSRVGGELTLLTQAGIKTKPSFQAMIKAMDSTGDRGIALQLVLNKLTSRLKGIAAANTDTLSGSFLSLRNNIGDFAKTIGKLILSTLSPLTNLLNKLFIILNKSKGLQEVIAPLGEFAAALIAVTIAVKLLRFAFVALSDTPLIAVILAILFIVVFVAREIIKHWSAIKAKLEPILKFLERIFTDVFDAIKNVILTDVEFIEAIISRLESVFKKIVSIARGVGKELKKISSPTTITTSTGVQKKISFAPLSPIASLGSTIGSKFSGSKSAVQNNTITMNINSNQADPSAVANQINESLKQHIRGAALTLDSSIKN